MTNSDTSKNLERLQFLAMPERTTANTVRFQEVVPPGADEVTGYFYVKKKALKKLGNSNGLLKITIEKADNDSGSSR